MNQNAETRANNEYKEMLKKRTKKIMERDKELNERGLPVGLDGPDYYKDIDDWFEAEIINIKKKYSIG